MPVILRERERDSLLENRCEERTTTTRFVISFPGIIALLKTKRASRVRQGIKLKIHLEDVRFHCSFESSGDARKTKGSIREAKERDNFFYAR